MIRVGVIDMQTCTVSHIPRAQNGLAPVLMFAVTILKSLIPVEEENTPFHSALGPVNYVSGSYPGDL